MIKKLAIKYIIESKKLFIVIMRDWTMIIPKNNFLYAMGKSKMFTVIYYNSNYSIAYHNHLL